MYIIVGLGNPGIAYQSSRHNMGFQVVNALSRELNIPLTRHAHKAILGEGFFHGEKVILAEPQTYMNLSGESVQALTAYYKLPMEHLIVVYDDIDLDIGDLRIRAGGSAGTHNGMRSIIACLGGEQGFPRIRVGVGKPKHDDLISFVLGKPGTEEEEQLHQAIAAAADAAMLIVSGGLAEAQATYNKKAKTKKKQEQAVSQDMPETDPSQA